MSDSPLIVNSVIKKEADEIMFGKGLMDILASVGRPHVSGSYALDLMTWRDLDIYVEVEDISVTDFFNLGRQICTVFTPVKMSFRNEMIAKTKGLPAGLYWGIYLGNERAGAWKIDIWLVKESECIRLLNHCADIKKALTAAARSIITEIKLHSWQDPKYRRSYTSADIYEAVLQNNVRDMEAFRNYLEQAGKNRIIQKNICRRKA